MPTTAQLRDLLGLPRNTKTRQVLNRAIRDWVPNGAQLLQRLETADLTRHLNPTNPHLIAEVNRLQRQRNMLIKAIKSDAIAAPNERVKSVSMVDSIKSGQGKTIYQEE